MLPTAPLALVLCWWPLEMETNSKCALRCGGGGWGQKRPYVPWPHQPNFRQPLGVQLWPISEKAQN